MFKTTLEETNGAKKETWVHVVKGGKLEPLLGDHNAEDLGIITVNAGGKIQKMAQSPEHQDSRTSPDNTFGQDLLTKHPTGPGLPDEATMNRNPRYPGGKDD